MKVQEQIKKYITSQPEPKRKLKDINIDIPEAAIRYRVESSNEKG